MYYTFSLCFFIISEILLNTQALLFIITALECLHSDGDEPKAAKVCDSTDQYCHFENKGKGSSGIKRDCTDVDDLKKIRRGYMYDVGCFVCRKPGGCKDDGYEDMNENEIQFMRWSDDFGV